MPEPVVTKDTRDRRFRRRSARQSKVLLELHGIKNPNSELAILSISDDQIALALHRIGTVEWISEPGWKVSKDWLNHGRPSIWVGHIAALKSSRPCISPATTGITTSLLISFITQSVSVCSDLNLQPLVNLFQYDTHRALTVKLHPLALVLTELPMRRGSYRVATLLRLTIAERAQRWPHCYREPRWRGLELNLRAKMSEPTHSYHGYF
jgi:hypothetical protein